MLYCGKVEPFDLNGFKWVAGRPALACEGVGMRDQLSKIVHEVVSNPRAGAMIGEGDRARDTADWAGAIAGYRRALDIDPSLAPIWVQYGHALKESGRRIEAESAYRKSLEIDPGNADTLVQLGHVLKLLNRPAEALQSYTEAQKLSPGDASIAREIENCGRNLGQKFDQGKSANHIYFDISDLVFYIGHHDNLTGIQRVQASIVLALLDVDLVDTSIHFLTYVNSRAAFYEIDQSYFIFLLQDLALELPARTVTYDKAAARDGYIGQCTPLQIADPGANNVLCLLGAAWVYNDYFLRIRNLKQNAGFRVMFMIHDLIPILARETCDQNTAKVFVNYMAQSYRVIDGFFCVSKNTRNDLVRYFEGMGLTVPEPIVTRNGALLPKRTRQIPVKAVHPELKPGNYILFVSTIEGRKNHMLAFRALEQLLAERGDIPYLVCVGRLGWRAEEFLFACEASGFLNGKIKILSEISDNELSSLYENCLFTIYPSIYEGWGLPVGESLSFGKLCITSNVTSLPEAGGEFADYVDPAKPQQLADAIRRYLDDPESLAHAEERIRNEYKSTPWTEVATTVLNGCLSVFDKPISSALPLVKLGNEYPMRALPEMAPDLMGERMVEEIATLRKRAWSVGLYGNSDYFDGQSARVGEGWNGPEAGFTWAKSDKASLAFRVEGSEPIVLYLAYCVSDPCINANLVIESSHQRVLTLPLQQHVGHVVLHGLKPMMTDGIAQYSIQLKIKGAPDLDAKLARIDSRKPAIGIRHFAVVAESDLATRLNITERLSFIK